MTLAERNAISFFLLATLVVLSIQTLFFPHLLSGTLGDTDAYLRIVILESHLLHGTPLDWNARDAAPYGVALQWSRLPSWLMLSAAHLFHFLGFDTRQALLAGAGLVQGTSLLFLAGALLWALSPVTGISAAATAAAVLLLHLPTLGYAAIHRPDHHLLVVLPAVLATGLLWRGGRLQHVIAGVLAGLSIWIHPEGIPLATLLMAALTLSSLRSPSLAPLLAGIGVTMILSLAALIDSPTDGAYWAIDRHGPAHALAASAALPGLFLLSHSRHIVRCLGVLSAASLSGITLLTLLPDLLYGSTSLMDPFVKTLWWDRIREIQPPKGGMILAHLSLPILGIGAAFLLLIRQKIHGPTRDRLLFSAIATLLLTLWTAGAARHTVLSASAGAITLGLSLPYLSPLLQIVFPLKIVFLGLLGVGLTSLTGREQISACSLSPNVRDILSTMPPTTILTPIDLAPEVLFHTPHRTIAGPSQRNAQGIRDALRVFHDPHPEAIEARQILTERGVTLILACPDSPRAGHLARRLTPDGHPPSWLIPIPLPDSRLTLHLVQISSESPPSLIPEPSP